MTPRSVEVYPSGPRFAPADPGPFFSLLRQLWTASMALRTSVWQLPRALAQAAPCRTAAIFRDAVGLSKIFGLPSPAGMAGRRYWKLDPAVGRAAIGPGPRDDSGKQISCDK